MDPQKMTLDPKLKEAYDSVMGVNTPPASHPPVAPTPPQAPQSLPQKPIAEPFAWHASDPQVSNEPSAALPKESIIPASPLSQSEPQIIAQPTVSLPQPSSVPHSPLPVPKIVAFHSSAQNTQQNKQTQVKKWRLRWVLVIFLIVAFLLGYAIFWIKVFGIKLPILSNFL